MHRRIVTGFTAVALAPALLALTAIAALIDEPTGANVLDIGSRRELFVDRYLIDRLDNATLKLHEPQLAPAMTEPADNLEYGTVIKDGDLFGSTRAKAVEPNSMVILRRSLVAKPTRFHPGRGESTDILFMTARGNGPFDRTFREAFIRPGLDLARWGNRSNYAALNIVPTGPTEMSIYTTPFRRFTLRLDCFASVHVGADIGELVTKPLTFTGKELVINYSTSAGGSMRVELQDAAGKAFPGFTLADSHNLVGDAIEQSVSWTKCVDISSLIGRPVRVRFVMQEADLFAIQFRPGE